MKTGGRKGASLIDLVVALGILMLLFAGIFLVYYSILDATINVEKRTEATSALNKEIEMIRNLPYAQIGTIGGIPAGVLPQEQNVSVGDDTFSVKTVVRNIDDPFDGTLGGTPGDTAPADYKLISLEISCPICVRFVPLQFTTVVSPKGLETAGQTGSLFVNVIDALGNPVPGATVQIVNASVTPSIDLSDLTNMSGTLQLVGVPTGTQSYAISVSKSGYSSERTYPANASSNPNPVKPNATVAVQAITNLTFGIDRTSELDVISSDKVCGGVGGMNFNVSSSKLIGLPSVLKFATSGTTNAQGSKILPNMEWDAYSMGFSNAGWDLAGTIPLSPFVLDPSTTVPFRFVVQLAVPDSLLVTVRDAATQSPVPFPTITVSKPGSSDVKTGGHAFMNQLNWGPTDYSSQDGGLDGASVPGTLALNMTPSSTYSTTTSWLISNTFDVGGAAATYYGFGWNGDQPPQAGEGSVKFQFAANNDNATWNFAGPDGTGSTYYAVSSSTLNSDLNGKRYLRFKVFLTTENENFTPRLDDVWMEFNSVCVPDSQSLFQGLSLSTYDIQVSAPGYITGISTTTLTADRNEITINLNK